MTTFGTYRRPGAVLRETLTFGVGAHRFFKADYPWLVYVVIHTWGGQGGRGSTGEPGWPGDRMWRVRHVSDLPEVLDLTHGPGQAAWLEEAGDGRPAGTVVELYGPRLRPWARLGGVVGSVLRRH